MIKGIIFDMDGLLVNTEVVSLEVYQRLLQKYGAGPFTQTYYAQNYSGHNEEDNMEKLIKEFELPITIKRGLIEGKKIEGTILAQGVAAKKGAPELLEFLSSNNYFIGLATSSKEDRAVTILQQNQILNYFDHLTFNAEIKVGKPAPDIYNKALDKMSLKPDEAIIYEDSEAGIAAGIAVGSKVICVPDMHIPAPQFLNETEKVYDDLEKSISYFTV